MNFKDTRITEEDGTTWIFSIEQQRALHEQGLPVEPGSVGEIKVIKKSQSSTSSSSRTGGSRGRDSYSEPENEIVGPSQMTIDPMTGKYIGQVKWFNGGKGYGFIIREAGEEIFFHRNDFIGAEEEIKDGAWVMFDVESAERGLEASEVEPYAGDPPE